MAIKVRDVVSNLPGEFGVAFGPCVRNDLAGAPYVDSIDIAIDGKGMQPSLLHDLKDNGFTVNKVKSYRANTYRRSQFTIDKGGKHATLNVYSPNEENGEYSIDDVMAARYSADTNRVWMDSTGAVDVIDGSNYSIDDIIEQIEEGQFKICDDGFSESEAEELRASGFSQVPLKPKKIRKPEEKERFHSLPVEVEPGYVSEVKQQHKEIAIMGTKANGFFNMVKADAQNAAYRVAATQITSGTKGAILAIMEKQGQNSEKIQTVKEMLDTEFGSALVSMAVGMGLTYAPKISEDPRVQRLASEFRVNGIATATNTVMETAMEYFLPVIMNALSALPETTETADIKARVTNPPENAKEEEESEESSAVAPPKKARA